jgi:hypothetical protein
LRGPGDQDGHRLVTRVTTQIAAALKDRGRPKPDRMGMERLVVYTDYLRGPIGMGLAVLFDKNDCKGVEATGRYEGLGIWPVKNGSSGW